MAERYMEQQREIAELLQPDVTSRPTSAPPVLEISKQGLFAFSDQRTEYTRIFTDIRCDENYPNFYESFSHSRKLPPPLEEPHSMSLAPSSREPVFDASFLESWEDNEQAPVNRAFPNKLMVEIPYGKNDSVGEDGPSRLKTVPAHLFHGSLPSKLETLSMEDFPLGEPPLPELSSDSETFSSTDDLNSLIPNYGVAQGFPGSGLLFPRSPLSNSTNYFNSGEAEKRDDLIGGASRAAWDRQELSQPRRVVTPPPVISAATTRPVAMKTEKRVARREESESKGAANGTSANGSSKDVCRYFASGYCSRGDKCQYVHLATPDAPSATVKPVEKAANNPTVAAAATVASAATSVAPTNANATAAAAPAAPATTKSRTSNHTANAQRRSNRGEEDSSSTTSNPSTTSKKLVSPRTSFGDVSAFTSVDQAIGHMHALSKDQHGCRFLQKQLEEQNPRITELIFQEIFPHFVELMTDPFGNYLCQKLLEYSNEKQRVQLIEKVAPHLVHISQNMHGTRAVQKMIEFLATPAMIQPVINGLRANVVTLIQDLNGNHVIQRCLNRLKHQDNQFIYDAVAKHCVKVATHRHGCCVMQRCIDFATEEQRWQLMAEIIEHSQVLVQDPFGNYVVQYIMDLNYPDIPNQLVKRFVRHLTELSTQKFSSNVVEKCMKQGDPACRSVMVTEMMEGDNLAVLLQDPYGNYVVQTALGVCDPDQYNALVARIRPHLPAIRNTPYGKRIQNKILKEKGDRSRSGEKDKSKRTSYS